MFIERPTLNKTMLLNCLNILWKPFKMFASKKQEQNGFAKNNTNERRV